MIGAAHLLELPFCPEYWVHLLEAAGVLLPLLLHLPSAATRPESTTGAWRRQTVAEAAGSRQRRESHSDGRGQWRRRMAHLPRVSTMCFESTSGQCRSKAPFQCCFRVQKSQMRMPHVQHCLLLGRQQSSQSTTSWVAASHCTPDLAMPSRITLSPPGARGVTPGTYRHLRRAEEPPWARPAAGIDPLSHAQTGVVMTK